MLTLHGTWLDSYHGKEAFDSFPQFRLKHFPMCEVRTAFFAPAENHCITQTSPNLSHITDQNWKPLIFTISLTYMKKKIKKDCWKRTPDPSITQFTEQQGFSYSKKIDPLERCKSTVVGIGCTIKVQIYNQSASDS